MGVQESGQTRVCSRSALVQGPWLLIFGVSWFITWWRAAPVLALAPGPWAPLSRWRSLWVMIHGGLRTMGKAGSWWEYVPGLWKMIITIASYFFLAFPINPAKSRLQGDMCMWGVWRDKYTGVEPSLRASAVQTPLFFQEILSWVRRRKAYIFQVKMVWGNLTEVQGYRVQRFFSLLWKKKKKRNA